MNTRRLLLAIFLVALATAMRAVPHPMNLTPVGAVALFSGASFDKKRWAFAIPFTAMIIHDSFIGYHSLMPAIYASINTAGARIKDWREHHVKQ